jgi:hypothetical protein
MSSVIPAFSAANERVDWQTFSFIRDRGLGWVILVIL